MTRTIFLFVDRNAVDGETPRRDLDLGEALKRVPDAGTPFKNDDGLC
jgi:hypothetical protein